MITLAKVICPRIMPLRENVHPIEWGSAWRTVSATRKLSAGRGAFALLTETGGGLDH